MKISIAMTSKTVLTYSGAIVAIAIPVALLWGVFADRASTGGFFPDLNKAIALVVVCVLNFLLLAIATLYWARYGAPLWMKAIVSVQVCLAAWTLWNVGVYGVEKYRGRQASELYAQMRDALGRDDVARFEQLSATLTTSSYSRDEQLLDAVELGAHATIPRLIEAGARPSKYLSAVRQSVKTCEGRFLGDMNALQLAVIRNDRVAIDELFAVADETVARSAVWLATSLDRVELIKNFAERGVDLQAIRGSVLDENESLLIAASEGAATTTAQWLIETYDLPANRIEHGPDPYRGRAPIDALLDFANETGELARAQTMLSSLVQHGASLESVDFRKRSPLRRAIEWEDGPLAQMLLNAGAQRDALTAEESQRLDVILQETQMRLTNEPEGCVKI
jgi:hypothetical protein